MRYYSTRSKSKPVSFASAALSGLAPDGGLYVPESIPQYPVSVKNSLSAMDLPDIAFETIRPFVEGEIPAPVLESMVHEAFSFAAPVVPVGDRLVLELFHGPTAAFKDFGARFMARAFSYLRRGEDKPLHILVATSGDTGGAVADGFFKVPGIRVTILYPYGRVSSLQERQIAGLGANIRAIAVEGSFDDCQRLVKAAFRDKSLMKRESLSSANSINISRLIPQILYYAAAAGKAFSGKTDPDAEATPRKAGFPVSHLTSTACPVTFCVPSGNFGNLTAGIYAKEMGAPIRRFIAATNINKTIPDYLSSGYYEAQPSKATISNAMDVGNPSNFERLQAQFSFEKLRNLLEGKSVSDTETKRSIASVYESYGYFLDPHTAVGWSASDSFRNEQPLIVLATAHPAKFAPLVEPLTGVIPVPASIQKSQSRVPDAQRICAELPALLEVL
ncbi:threonine synthase [Spirochaetia bacterium]|nr:threonine synthase [Spirochaetia bacterium]